jgi:hypothetical protein
LYLFAISMKFPTKHCYSLIVIPSSILKRELSGLKGVGAK